MFAFELPRRAPAYGDGDGRMGQTLLTGLAAAGESDLRSALICRDWLQAASRPL